MMMAAVYLQPTDVGLIDGFTYEDISSHENVAIAAPLAFGDSFQGAPVVGTTADFVEHLANGEIEGRLWEATYEGIAGADVPLEIGSEFEPAHGVGDVVDEGAHAGAAIRVVGRMSRTGSPWDKAIMVPVESVWEVHGLAMATRQSGSTNSAHPSTRASSLAHPP